MYSIYHFFKNLVENKKYDLISQSFSQVLEERLEQSGIEIEPSMKEILMTMFSEQENFSKVRTIDDASVKLRFRIMTEVKAEGNILNSSMYPGIKENTINFVIPYHNQKDKQLITKRMKTVFSVSELKGFLEFDLKHYLNGYFLVFQQDL